MEWWRRGFEHCSIALGGDQSRFGGIWTFEEKSHHDTDDHTSCTIFLTMARANNCQQCMENIRTTCSFLQRFSGTWFGHHVFWHQNHDCHISQRLPCLDTPVYPLDFVPSISFYYCYSISFLTSSYCIWGVGSLSRIYIYILYYIILYYIIDIQNT